MLPANKKRKESDSAQQDARPQDKNAKSARRWRDSLDERPRGQTDKVKAWNGENRHTVAPSKERDLAASNTINQYFDSSSSLNGTSLSRVHPLKPITEKLAASCSNMELAPFVSRDTPTFRPRVSDPEREQNIMDTVILNCMHINIHLSQCEKKGGDNRDAIRTNVKEWQEQADEYIHTKLPYDRTMSKMKEEFTALFCGKLRTRYMETIFWHFIRGAAKHIDPGTCPTPRGPLDEFTRQEKAAHRQFMLDAGYTLSRSNERYYRRLWKNLYEMRETGISKILLYRTAAFNSFCASFPRDANPSLIEIVSSWEDKYSSQIEFIERRTQYRDQNERSQDPFLSQPNILVRLEVDRGSWTNDTNSWYSEEEAAGYYATSDQPKLTHERQVGVHHYIPTKKYEGRDMSLFVTLQPRGNELIVTIKPGDFLGIFAGQLRYSDSLDETHGIASPQAKLWLDYSQVTGAFNLMKASLPGGPANVRLDWESFKSGRNSRPQLRVAIRATREIKPFDELNPLNPQALAQPDLPALPQALFLKALCANHDSPSPVGKMS
ncbi:hypothetical protein NQ176_g269 [Zarea fungicola]|uniref:Uncharacterized protein n=1 Tax=Zarea fungicola TaxID=93591 RepID=A0ACC1NXI2_9HYPO|nr:hypothetical protein NQ176_g269 [Lecanicillium fungicola]